MAQSGPEPHPHPTDRLVGNALAIQSLRIQIRHLAAFDTVGSALVPTLLLQGETGTGKGLVARVIHDSGPRAAGPFVDINCAAIPETLLEAELFGFEAGTFTDARRSKPGLMESAAQGTLFLDEIDALPLLLQSKLLSVLDEKRVRRLGAVASRQIDVKVIAATPTNLAEGVAAGRFRPGLYYRLAVVLLEIPPLRQRGEDILVLAQNFLRQAAAAHGLPPKQLSRDAEAWLRAQAWPGNVRELRHLMERVTLLCSETLLHASTLEHLCLLRPPQVASSEAAPVRSEEASLDEPARIRQALAQTGGNVVQAARLLGLHRGALRYRMRQYGLPRPDLQALPPPPSNPVQAASRPREIPQRQVNHTEPHALAAAWEQKLVVVLALDITWRHTTERHAPAVDPWTQALRCQQHIAETLQGFGGHLLQTSPALVIAVFGLLQTLEQMPHRAVHAALVIQRQLAEDQAVNDRQTGPEVRMAVHLGQGLVDVQASNPAAQFLPLEETLSLPVRLLGYAAPGDIVLSSQMGRLVEGWFELRRTTGPGSAEHAEGGSIYTVVGLGVRHSPLEVYGRRPLSRFVGRERELTALHEILTRAEQGRGQVVGIVGEPGVGKSRLCYELTQAQRLQSWLVLESSPTAYSQNIPYTSVIEILTAYFQLDARDGPATIRDKVMAKLRTLDEGLIPVLSPVLALLDVPVDDPHWQALAPSQRRQHTLEACTRLLLRLSQAQPLLLVMENLHWIDTETQTFLERLVDSLLPARLLLLVTYRPDYHHGWSSKTYYTQLRIDPLPPAPAEALLHELLGAHPALAPLIQRLIVRTEGNPFFLEESVRTLVETGALVGVGGAYHLAQALPTIQMPATVLAVLAARIDRLPSDEKQLLQTAAVIGTEVSLALLQAIVEVPETAVHHSLMYLQGAEFVYETLLFAEQVYTFKHALTHEVAYGSLLQERRRVLHARIVEALERFAGDHLADHVERLATHAIRGEVWDKALLYCRQAGVKAMGRSAYREAFVSLEQAMVAAQHLPEQRDTLVQTYDLCIALRSVLQALREPARAFTYLRQAATLAEKLGDHRRICEIYPPLIHSCWSLGEYDEAIAYSHHGQVLATANGDGFEQAVMHGLLGTVYFSLGDYRRAMDILRQFIAFLTGELLYKRFGIITHSVRARVWLIECCAEVGEFAEGRACGAEAARLAREANNPSGAIFSQSRLGHLILQQGDLDQAIAVLEAAYAHCHTADIPLFLPGVTVALGLAYALSGRETDALALLDQIVLQDETGGGGSAMMIRQGEAYLVAGRPEYASHLAERALVLSRDRKERGNQAWALRLLGEIARHGPPSAFVEAEIHYRQALALAEERGMRPLAAHCHRGLGTLSAQAGQATQARTALATAIDLYRTMDMIFWLPQTEAALAQVGTQ